MFPFFNKPQNQRVVRRALWALSPGTLQQKGFSAIRSLDRSALVRTDGMKVLP
jgi:hypothetical protein